MNRAGAHAAEFLVGDDEFVVISVPLRPARVVEPLSVAEREIAGLIVQGLSNEAIAQRRGKSIRTIANQVGSAMRKLSVGSRLELASTLALHPFEVRP